MRGRLLLPLTVALAAGVAGAWGYVAFQHFARYETCYDIQGDPDTVRVCDAYTRHVAAGSHVAVAVSAASFVLLLSVLVVSLRGSVRK
jgi:hypothetical protein